MILFLVPMVLIGSLAWAYTRDYDTADPIDHSLNSTWPAEIREVMTDISERLDDIMNGFTSGDTVTDFNLVPLNNRAADPTAVADTLNLYSKDVSAKAELFAQDEDSDEIQITDGGKINSAVLSGTTLPSAWQDKVWPVGSVYIAVVSTNPNTLLGFGTWSAIGAGKTLVGLDSGDTDFDTVEETSGAKTQTISTSYLPASALTVTASPNGAGGAATCPQVHTAQSCSSSFSTSNMGSGTALPIVQPSFVVYFWKRTA